MGTQHALFCFRGSFRTLSYFNLVVVEGGSGSTFTKLHGKYLYRLQVAGGIKSAQVELNRIQPVVDLP